ARFRCFQDFNCTPEASFGNSQGTADQFNFLVGFRFTFRPEEAVGCSDTNFVCSQRLRAAKWEICGNKCRFYTAFSQKMHENFFVRRRLPGFSLHFAFELAEHDKLIGVGLLAASINLQIAQDQRALAVLLQENKWIWRPKLRRVQHVGIDLTRGNNQARCFVFSFAHRFSPASLRSVTALVIPSKARSGTSVPAHLELLSQNPIE